jgi:hypothetical protein
LVGKSAVVKPVDVPTSSLSCSTFGPLSMQLKLHHVPNVNLSAAVTTPLPRHQNKVNEPQRTLKQKKNMIVEVEIKLFKHTDSKAGVVSSRVKGNGLFLLERDMITFCSQ